MGKQKHNVHKPTPRACMEDISTRSWAPVPAKCCHCQVFGNQTLTCVKIESKTAAYETTEEGLCLCVFNNNNLDLNEWQFT